MNSKLQFNQCKKNLCFCRCLEFDDEVFDKQAAIDAFQKR